MTIEPVRLHHESRGRRGDPVVVLIAGLAQQLTMWPAGFVHAIVVGGYQVVLLDNRDIGLSGRTPGGKVRLRDVQFGDAASAPYTLATMAGDVIRLLDDIGVDRAHVVGHSMGGMVAQELAARHPERTGSLVSLMSSTGALDVGRPTALGQDILYRPLPADPAAAVARLAANVRGWSTAGELDEAATTAQVRREYRRGYDTAGVGRQIAAVRASGDRTETVSTIRAPTVVIHGTSDPIIDVSGGRATAAAVPGSRYIELPGVGHDLPFSRWPDMLRPMHELWRSAR